MKLMFICGASVRDGALKCPSWVRGMLTRLDDDSDITLLSVGNSGAQEECSLKVGDRSVTLVPEHLWNSPERFTPFAQAADVIVIFGTESAYSLSAMELCEAVGASDKAALFAQGMACACAEHYADGVPEKVIRRWTLRDILRKENIQKEQEKMAQRAISERKAIAKARHFIGRTTMDKEIAKAIRPDINYYHCNDILRNSFYEGQWRYEACGKHRVFISQYYYPIKGFHYLLEAASKLRFKYPDLMIAAAGYNPIHSAVDQNETKDSSYIRYIKSLIRKYGLKDNIELLGELSEEQMKAEYLKANIFVLPSTIENSPNSLAEAMILGVPCIAADVGGVSDFADHKKDAYIYPPSATDQLAQYLDTLLSDPEEAARIGANAKQRAAADFDIKTNVQTMQNAFKAIAKKS